MDPLSITAGIIGIAATAAHTARRLKEFLDSIKEGPETVRSIAKEIGILYCSLIALEDVLPNDDDFSEAAQPDEGRRCIDSLMTILVHCQENLVSIHQTVKPFVEKQNGSKEHKWRTMAGWASRKETLDSLKRELVNAKMTLDLGITFATFLLTRASISQLQTQFTQLNTRLEEEASNDNMSDVGSSSVVTDLGFAIRRFLNERDATADSSISLTRTDDQRPARDIINNDFGWRSRKVDDHDFARTPKNGGQHNRGHSFNSTETFRNASSPSGSPLTKQTTFNSIVTNASTSPITSFTTSFPRMVNRSSKRLESEGPITNRSQPQQPISTNHGRLPERPLLTQIPSGLNSNDDDWKNFSIPLKVFSDYFRLSFKKMIQKSPTSMINFGIVTATPISNSPVYADIHADTCGNGTKHAWDQINDAKLYRRSSPHWTLKVPSHKAAGGPPTKGVSRISLSKVVIDGLSYEFIRLFVVAQTPLNATDRWRNFYAFTYVGRPRRTRDIGMDESTRNVTTTIPDVTPVSVWLAVKGETLTFRLKTADDKHFLDPLCAYWSMDPDLAS